MTALEPMLETLRRVLEPGEYDRIEEELREAKGRGERHWIEDVFEAATTLSLQEVPPIVSRDLRDLFLGRAPLESHRAELVKDSRADGFLVGVRGSESGEGWTLTYASEVADLVVDVWPSAEHGFDIDGHLMRAGGSARAVGARVAGPSEMVVGGDALGRFRFVGLAEGEYTLFVDDGAVGVEASLDLGSER